MPVPSSEPPKINKAANSLAASEGSLTRRAGLSFVNSLLQQGSRLLVGFVVTPIVIRGLGAELYGAWMMLQQTVGYLALSDLRPMGTLRLTLAVRQHVEDVEEKRRQIGAAISMWVFTLPILLSLGALLVWTVPFFIRTSPEYVGPVRIAMALLVLFVALERILTLPHNVLLGMNVDYKAMGLNALAILLGGAFIVLAIRRGFGLPGIAIASIAGSLITCGINFQVVRRVIPWFGVSSPKRKELSSFVKLSGWFFLATLSELFIIGSDLLLVGIILGPAAAAVYATTGAVLRVLMGPVIKLIDSGGSGIAGLCGKGEWPRLIQVRMEMFIIAITLMAFLGLGVLLLNESFLKLWVGNGFYAGQFTNFLLVLIAFLEAFSRIDGLIITGMLDLRSWSLVMLLTGSLIILLGIILIIFFGYPGMALAIIMGRLLFISYQQLIISRKTGLIIGNFIKTIARPFIKTLSFLILCYIISYYYNFNNLISFVIALITIIIISSVIIYYVVLRKEDRNVLIARISYFSKSHNSL